MALDQTPSQTADINDIRTIIRGHTFDGPESEVKHWLTNLRVLKGIPFQYIVPTGDALPSESVRFFHIDRNWTDALIDGALSVSLTTTTEKAWLLEGDDKTRYQSLLESLNQREAWNAGAVRNLIRHNIQGNNTSQMIADKTVIGGGLTGMLFRSKIIKDYPGIEISAFDHTSGTNPWSGVNSVPVVRMSRLSESIMLCIFNGRPTHLRIQEPAEGIRMGIETGTSQGTYSLKLKNLNGEIIQGPEANISVPMRPNNPSIIRVGHLYNQIKSTLDDLPTPIGHENMDSALIATELLQYPYQQDYLSILPTSENHPTVKGNGGGL